VNVAVVDGKTITESVELRTTKQGEPVRIKAVKNGKYILAEGTETPVAPENLTIKRVGNDLHVATEGTDPSQPQLIIEGFYESQGQLVGVAEDGAYYEYISSDGDQDQAAAFLHDGASSPQVLGSQELVGFGNGLVAGNGVGWLWPALLGLGALGLLGAAYALTRDKDSNNNDGGAVVAPNTPSIGGATDNVGAEQGPINKGDSTDDTTPTFTGTGTPGNVIIISDNGKPIGEVIVGDDGNWEFTPTTPLPEGEHSIIVVEKDKDGNVSKPSDEFDFIVDITAPGKSVINSIIDDFGDQQGVIEPNGYTDDNTPTLSGMAEAGAKLEVFANGEKIGETIVNADGTWSFTPSPALADGEYSFTTVATDAAGNVGLPSDPYVVTIDTIAPVKPGVGTGGIEEAIDNVDPIIGDIGNGGTTDDSTPTFTGGGLLPGDKVTIIDDGVVIGEVIVGEDGRWEFTPDPALTEGPHPITVIVTDPAGNKSEPSDPYIVIVDITAPGKPGAGTGGIEAAIDNVDPLVGDIGNGGTTDDGTPTLIGVGLTEGDIVTIIDNGVEIGKTVVKPDGTWEFTPDPALIDGPHPITVVITDPAGNSSEPSDPYIIIVDTTAPVAPTIDSVFDDQGTTTGNINPGDITDDAQPQISGQAEPNSTVIIYDNGVEIGRETVGADGRWTHTPVPPLLNGPHDLSAKAQDAAGNISDPSNSVDFELVTGGLPPAPAITGVTDDVADDLGNIMPGGSTNDTEPQVTGTAEPGSTVTLFANGVPVGTIIADALGNWTITPNPALTEGVNNLTATATNSAGNTSVPTGIYPITVDTMAPAAADGSLLEDNVGPVTDPIVSGSITDDNTPTYSGTAEPNTTLIIFDNGVEIGRVPVDPDGNWNFTPTPLVDGPHSFSTQVVDAAGNRSPLSTPIDFTVDTSAVAISIEQALDNVGPIQDPLTSGSVTDDATPTLRGQATPGATVNIYLDGVLLAENVPVNGLGRWEYTVDPALPEGSYAFTATVVTPATGESAPTAPFNLEIDLTPSAAPSIDAILDDVGDLQDPLSDGSTTDDTTPTLVGSGVAGDMIIIRNNGLEIGREMVGRDGRWTFTPNPPLNNGSTNEFDVIAQDPAGNQSAPSDSWTIIIDTEVPMAPTIDSVFDDQGAITGNINPGTITDDAQPLISGQAEPNSLVIIYDNGVEIGRERVNPDGSWTHTPVPGLLNGPHDLSARTEDAAGNVSEPSNNFDFELIAGGSPPAPAITGVTDDVADDLGNIMPGGSTNDTEPQVTGTAEPGSTVTLFANGVPVGTIVADPLGNWTITPNPALTEGVNNLTATATNSAGNASAPTGIYPITVDTIAPAAADASLLEDNVGPVTDPIVSGSITDDSTPTYSGTAEPNTILIIFDNGVEIDRVPVDDAGNWNFTPATPLVDGPHSFSTQVVDAAGNRSPISTPIDFTVDTSAVAISIEQALDNVGSIQDPLASGSVTDDATPTLRGQATPGATVNIYLDGVLLQADVPVNGLGRWEYTVDPALPEGSYAFTATVVTPANGESAPTADFNLEIDLTPSAAPSIDAILDDVGSIQDPLADGASTDDTTPTLVGSGVTGDTIIIRNNGVEIGRVPVVDGSWSYTPNPPLNNGSTNVFDVIAQDPAGNQSVPSAPWTINIDTVAPAAPTIDQVIDNVGVGGAIGNGGTTDDTTPELRGTAEPGSVVTIYDGNTAIGTVNADPDTGVWSFTTDTLTQAIHQFTARAVDAAGNISDPSNAHAINVSRLVAWEFNTTGNLEGWVAQGRYATSSAVDGGMFASNTEGGGAGGFSGNVISRTIQVVAGETYDFSMQFRATIRAANGTILQFRVDGTPIGVAVDTQANPAVWRTATGTFTAASTGTVTLSIFNHVDATLGNDFGIDRITMQPRDSVSSTAVEADTANHDDTSLAVATDLSDVFEVAQIEQLNDGLSGGSGIDTLKLTGADQVLDLSKLVDEQGASIISSIEIIDITGTGNNTLNLSLGDVLELGETSLFTEDETVQMMIKGNAGDVVNLDDLLADGTDPGDWAGQGQVTVEGVTYNVFQHSGLDAQLLVQDGVTTNLV
jgi:hypothetical protein